MEFDFKDMVFLGTQVVVVGSAIVTNRESIKYLKTQSAEHKDLIEKLQETVVDLRIRVGV